MKISRVLLLGAVFASVVVLTFLALSRKPVTVADHIAIYYAKLDGQTLDSYTVTLGAAHDPTSVAFYAATQAVAGPPPPVKAVRFPAGTFARSVVLNGSTATVDLSGNVKSEQGGSFAESAEFKALVWTMTALPGVHAVRIKVDGASLVTLPGGHLELDEPLTRGSW